jgi:hypothetical protein
LQEAILSAAQKELIFPPAKGWTISDGGKDWSDLNLLVATRLPLRGMNFLDHALMDANGVAARYDIEVRGSLVRFVNMELPTIQPGLAALVDSKWKGLPELSDVVTGQTRAVLSVRKWIGHGEIPLIAGGDLNVTDDNPVYRAGWSGFDNAFDSAGHGFGYTKMTKWVGLRIDHLLAGPGWRTNWCRVGPKVGTAHQPVTAEMEWIGSASVFSKK